MLDNLAQHATRRRLRAAPLALSLAWLLAPAFWFGASVAAEGPPHAEFATEEIDLGKIDRGAVVTASFEIRNTGGSDLQIRNVKPG